MQVTVSGKWARHRWACTKERVENECHGRCCECNGKSEIPLGPDERERFLEAATATGITGWTIEDGVLKYSLASGGCPGKTPSGLCRWHGTITKPWSCVASPFALSPSGETLIIRRRYTQMKCHTREGELAYLTFFPSLVGIFGREEAARIRDRLDAGDDHVTADMPDVNYQRLKHIGHVRAGKTDNETDGILGLLAAEV